MEEHFKDGTLHIGIVVANDDPEGLGRIRVEIPGVLEPRSSWAFPVGGSGGGGATSGWFDVPALNSFVGVLFHAGEMDQPYYLGGWHGKGEVPAYLSSVAIGERKSVKIYETKLFHMIFDDRDSAKVFVIKNKSTGDYISIGDSETKIKAATKVTVEAPQAVVTSMTSVTVTSPHVVVTSASIDLGTNGLVAPMTGILNGTSMDPFTGLPHWQLGNASAVVKALK